MKLYYTSQMISYLNRVWKIQAGQPHLNPNRVKTLYISFQPTGTRARAPVTPSRAGVIKNVIKNNSSKTYPMDVLHHNFIRLGPTRAKALQTARRFPRETRRPFAVTKMGSP